MNTKDKDIIYGNVEISEDEFAPQHTKIRVTTLIDEDALQGLKVIAEKKGVKYQTLLNKVVRNYVSDVVKPYGKKKEITAQDVRQIVRQELKKKKA